VTARKDIPVGTAVLAYPARRPEDDSDAKVLNTRTRSEPWLVGGQLVVLVDGYAGGIALTHIDEVAG